MPDLSGQFSSIERAPKDLARKLGGTGPWTLALTALKGQRSGRSRAVFRAESLETGRSVAVKAHQQRFRNWAEYRALQQLGRAVPDCIAPLYVDGRLAYYVMEWSQAPLLSQVLEGSDREAALVRAGKWLARLHKVAIGPRLRLQRRPMIQLPETGETAAIQQTALQLKARLASLPSGGERIALLHGDFSAANFFDTGNRVLAFDREHNVAGDVNIDGAKFLSDIAIRRARAKAEGHPWSGTYEADRENFLAGYGSASKWDARRFDLFEDLFLFRTWWRDMRQGNHALDGHMHSRGLLAA